MRRLHRTASAVLALALALSAGTGWSASAAQPSTPDATVVLNNPAATGAALTVTAHSDEAGALHGSLTYRNGDVVLRGLELHRLWVPGLSDHEPEAASAEATDGACGDGEEGVVKIRGLSTQRGVGQVQVWIDVRPGHEGTDMVRVRVRPKTDCGGHDEAGHITGEAEGDHGAWTHNSGWVPLQVLNVHSRG